MKISPEDYSILVVDDDKNILKVIKMRLEATGFSIKTADQMDEAIEIATDHVFDLALLDLKLAKQSGIDLMEKLHQINPELPIIILTAYGTIESAVEAIQKGATSYLTKPFDYQELLDKINNCLEASRQTIRVRQIKNLAIDIDRRANIIAESEKMNVVIDQIAKSASSDASIYIEGESGTGKELIARMAHAVSQRKDKPFVVINCAAIPENLLESELFGYVKGAFTGANTDKDGLLTMANTGTFFMDEISEMPLPMQAKLLRVIQEKEFYPLGNRKIVKTDFRLISTSNRELKNEVEKGTFREDLFYRIHVIIIKLPPLRERREDIPLLAKFFLKEFSKKANRPVKGFSTAAIQKLMLYNWPGNVRELKNEVERAVIMTATDILEDSVILQGQELNGKKLKPLKQAKKDFEKNYLTRLIEITGGNISEAAKLSGKYRADLYELLKKYKLNPSDFRDKP